MINLIASSDQLQFSSEDSLNTDNSFNSSTSGQNNDDYKNNFFHLKEQISVLFNQNPILQDQIDIHPEKFEEYDEKDSQQEEEQPMQKGTKNDKKAQLYKESLNKVQKKHVEKPQKSKLWGTITKDIIKNGQFSSKIPTLDVVQHRMNIFRTKLNHIDYLDLLLKENPKDKISQQLQQHQKLEKEKEKKEFQFTLPQNIQVKQQNKLTDRTAQDDEEIEYFSYKKKIQKQTQEKRLEMQEKQMKKKFLKRNSLTMRGKSKAKLFGGKDVMFFGGKMILSRNKSANFLSRNTQANDDNRAKFTQVSQDDNAKKQNIQPIDKDIEFKSRVGQVLYQTMQQSNNDIESFKKTAIYILKDYNKKKQDFQKQRIFPPQVNKFQSDETKILNNLLPDFQNPMFPVQRVNVFNNIDNFKIKEDSDEQKYLKIAERINNGKVISRWKEQQAIQ